MRKIDRPIVWLIAAVLAVGAIWWLYPKVYPIVDRDLVVDRGTARAIALERLADLGSLPDDPYVITTIGTNPLLERKLQHLAASHGLEAIQGSRLAEDALRWVVVVYRGDARPNDWSHRAEVKLDGRVHELRRRLPAEEGGEAPSEEAAIARAEQYLAAQNEVDRTTLVATPTLRPFQTGDRLDLAVRYPFDDTLAEETPHGIDVLFNGDQLVGFRRFVDIPDADELSAEFRPLNLVNTGLMLFGFAIVIVVAIPFLRRYHDGQLGLRRGVQIVQLCFAFSVVGMLFVARAMTEGNNWGNLSRPQNTLVMGAVMFAFSLLTPIAATAMVWPLGEWWARRRWPEKLAAFDAVFRGRFGNATVARSALRGVSGGLVLTAIVLAVDLVLARQLGALPLGTTNINFLTASPLPAVAWLGFTIGGIIPLVLFAYFLVPTWAEVRFGKPGWLIAGAVGIVYGVMLAPTSVPMWALLVVATVVGIAMIAAFRYGDLLSMIITGLIVAVSPAILPAMHASSPWFQANAWIALLVLLTPMLLSIRHLNSQGAFQYTWDDVPPHVRRIAERERQRVELETARGIQQSILPELPPQLGGIEVAHTYKPASEVGGDFYDVLALDDGRLAVAVGDVAGHGVSSGLVMSMAKSALAVQVTFDPNVEAVLGTLNRMVYQSARARLLTTLCYALIDPERREVLYASAGHLFPYVVSPNGRVRALEASSYPLGVRGSVDARVHNAKLEAGESLFLYSDGLVEASPHGDDEQFGFDRLEQSLANHAHLAPGALRDAVLADVDRFTGDGPRDDDLTVLVLRMPSS